MKFRSLLTAICVLAAAQTVSAAPFAYIANSGTKNVSVIDTADNTVKATVALPDDNADTTKHPSAYCITVGASGQYVYVGLKGTNEVNIIDTSTNTVIMNRRIPLGTDIPGGLAVNAAETRLYVTSNMSNNLLVIDISGPVARELKRVYLGTSVPVQSMTNPEGVVINPAGTKAYVANSTKDTIAEVALDEVNNIYTQSSLISAGAGSYPIGLAISSDGTKLYFSSMNGNAGIIDTSTKVVTTLPTNTFNVSVAVNPVSGNVYAPSGATDTIYAFSSTGTPLGSYATAAAPWGSSVTPNPGSKLFVAMNIDNTVKVYNTANLADAPASIDLTLTAGGNPKPTSLGNFIGPVWDHTIAASATAPCTITPSGTVPVNSHGWKFTISGTGCNVTVNGASVGAVTSYEFNNVVDNTQTISVSQTITNAHTLTASWISSVGGYLKSTPAGIDQNSPIAQFADGTTVSINAPAGFKAISWTGDCAGTADGQPCVFNNLTADKTLGATVIVAPAGGPIFDGSNYYQTWAACTSGAANYAVIKLSTDIAALTTDGPSTYTYTVSNQWNKADYSQKGAYTPMTLTITGVAVIASDLTL